MIGKQTLKQVTGQEIAISENMSNAIELWGSMYENEAPWLNDEITSLNLPAAIASEISRLATLELKVVIEGSARADYLADQFQKVSDELRDKIEYGAAKGGLVIKPYPDGENLNVDFVQADQFFPIDFDSNGNITACIFVDQRQEGDKYYKRLEMHELKNIGYIIRNMAFVSNTKNALGSKVDLSVIEDWADLEEEATITGVDKPLFAYFRYPLANNVDTDSPLGVSCYARAVNRIKDADVQWSDFLWEFESAKRALYADSLAFEKDKDGRPKLPHKRLYRSLDMGGKADDLFKEWTPTLREKNLLNGLDAILKRIEFSCGLAYGTLSDPQSVDKTATEIKSSKQRSYATVVDVQKAVRKTLDSLLYAMDIWTTLSQLASKGEYTVTYTFDDSVVVDKDVQFQQDLRLVQQGLMSGVEFRMRNMGEDEKTAKQRISEAKADQEEDTLFSKE